MAFSSHSGVLNLTHDLRRDPPLVRTITIVGEGHQGQGRVVHRDRPDQGSRAVDQGTEEHCYGRGTGPGHARLVVAGVAQGSGSGSVQRYGRDGWCRRLL